MIKKNIEVSRTHESAFSCKKSLLESCIRLTPLFAVSRYPDAGVYG